MAVVETAAVKKDISLSVVETAAEKMIFLYMVLSLS